VDPARFVMPGADRSRLLALVDALSGRRVAIVGDLIADEFIYGRIARVSREAPVLILNYDSTEIVPGGAGNAAANVAALGGAARAVGLVGRDEAGRRLIATLNRRRVDARGIFRPAGYRTPTKTRILAGGIHSAKQQVVRIDRVSPSASSDAMRKTFATRVLAAVRGCDGLLVSDYGSGLVTPALVAEAQRRMQQSFRLKAEATKTPRAAANARPSRGFHLPPSREAVRRTAVALAEAGQVEERRPIVLVDSRYNLLRYRGMTACTPNESEVEQALGITIGDNMRVLERAGRAILRRTRATAVLITRGSRGMALFEPDRQTVHIRIVGSDQIADVTGAGDTVIATMTLALATGASFEEAAHLANYAGGIVVMKRGTATVNAGELRHAIANDISG
jgi:bifunctional ADP-heptose synthase (sugar kinase/adenylyltransferase)